METKKHYGVQKVYVVSRNIYKVQIEIYGLLENTLWVKQTLWLVNDQNNENFQ